MKSDDIEAMKRAMAAYAGPVTRCSPGQARAKPLRRKKVVRPRDGSDSTATMYQ